MPGHKPGIRPCRCPEALGASMNQSPANRYGLTRAARDVSAAKQWVPRRSVRLRRAALPDHADGSSRRCPRGSPLSGGVLSLGLFLGFLTVFRIAARNGILSSASSSASSASSASRDPSGPDLVLRGPRERLAPSLMTALATVSPPAVALPAIGRGPHPGRAAPSPRASRNRSAGQLRNEASGSGSPESA